MNLEQKLKALQETENLNSKHKIARTILDEILAKISGLSEPEYVSTKEGKKVVYGDFWYHKEYIIKVDVPGDDKEDPRIELAKSLDTIADVIETVIITGASREKCIPVYYGDEPIFSFVFGFNPPRIFIPGYSGPQGPYTSVLEFAKNPQVLLNSNYRQGDATA